jgi:hypothetical protein
MMIMNETQFKEALESHDILMNDHHSGEDWSAEILFPGTATSHLLCLRVVLLSGSEFILKVYSPGGNEIFETFIFDNWQSLYETISKLLTMAVDSN